MNHHNDGVKPDPHHENSGRYAPDTPDDDIPVERLEAIDRANRPEPPPHDLDAEASLLGAMLLSERARDNIGNLTPDDFYRPSHAHIFTAITQLHEGGHGVDTVTVASELGGLLDVCGGPAALDSLIATTPATSNAETYARTVSSTSRRRQQMSAAHDLIAAARLGHPTSEALGQLEDLEGAGSGAQAVRLGDTLPEYLDLLDDRIAGTVTNGFSTGLADLDAEIGGLRPGEFIVTAARPAIGKSDLGCQIGVNVAEAGHAVLVVSVEMGLVQLQDRWVANASGVRHHLLRSGDIADKDWPHLSEGIAKLGPIPLYIQDDPSASLATIRHQARRVPDLDMIIVDYLQLMETMGRPENRQVAVADLSKGLKRLARDLEVPVMALAQLNRGVEQRLDKRPTLGDMRESGAIEQDADIVIGLYRDEVYNKESKDRGIMEAIILKNRAGALATVQLAYMPDMSRIYTMVKAAA